MPSFFSKGEIMEILEIQGLIRKIKGGGHLF